MNKTIVFSILGILFIAAVSIAGFIYFNRRLTESKKLKEYAAVTDQSSMGAISSASSESFGAAESGMKLVIISPSNGATVTAPVITLRGKTVPDADVFVNDKDMKSDANGDFSLSLTLEEGENPILIVANDALGTAAEDEITITYEPVL